MKNGVVWTALDRGLCMHIDRFAYHNVVIAALDYFGDPEFDTCRCAG